MPGRALDLEQAGPDLLTDSAPNSQRVVSLGEGCESDTETKTERLAGTETGKWVHVPPRPFLSL